MLSQEFDLPDVLRIWDSLLCDETRRDFLLAVCTAMVVLVRDDLLHNEFPDNMKLLQVRHWHLKLYVVVLQDSTLLQNFPFTDVQIILSKAASFIAWRHQSV